MVNTNWIITINIGKHLFCFFVRVYFIKCRRRNGIQVGKRLTNAVRFDVRRRIEKIFCFPRIR